MINRNKSGLTLGLFMAILHAVWALAVAIIPNTLQSFLDNLFDLHFLESVWKLTAFNLIDAVFLVVITFGVGYIFGWVFAWTHNLYHKKN